MTAASLDDCGNPSSPALERASAGASAGLAEKDTAIQRLSNDKTNEAIDGTIGNDLTRAGVKKTLIRGATALVREGRKFEVEPSDDGDGNTVLVHTDFGLVSVSDVVGPSSTRIRVRHSGARSRSVLLRGRLRR